MRTAACCEDHLISGFVLTRDSCHGSHRRLYAEFEVLDALRAGVPPLFAYGIGFSTTFEWFPAWRYLIPFYAAEVGGMVDSARGHILDTSPSLGLHLWASDSIWISAAAGCRVVPASLSDRSGPTFALRGMFNPR